MGINGTIIHTTTDLARGEGKEGHRRRGYPSKAKGKKGV